MGFYTISEARINLLQSHKKSNWETSLILTASARKRALLLGKRWTVNSQRGCWRRQQTKQKWLLTNQHFFLCCEGRRWAGRAVHPPAPCAAEQRGRMLPTQPSRPWPAGRAQPGMVRAAAGEEYLERWLKGHQPALWGWLVAAFCC